MPYEILILIVLAASCTSCFAKVGPRIGPEKKLIKTGQDMPNAAYLRKHIRAMERYAFDGVTIDLNAEIDGKRERLAYRWWAPEEIGEECVRDSVEDLKAIDFRRFTDNFLWISTQSQPLPAPSWQDDEAFAKIKANMVLAARIAKECGLKGIFLDVEQYGGMKWSRWMMRFNYPSAHANEKGMLPRKLVDKVCTWEEYEAAARKRGKEIMSAMCQVYPNLTILVLPGLHQVAKERIGHGRRYCPDEELGGLASSDYGLLAPFGDGMLAGATPEATIIDGHERSYAFTLNKRFIAGRKQIADASDVSAVPRLYRQRMHAGFGLMLDNRYHVRGGWHTEQQEFIHNHFTPGEFSNALYFAMLNADRYVWIWNELNGAVFFDSPPRKPEAKANVPQQYVLALEQAREPRDRNAGRDNAAAESMPIPKSASEMVPGYGDEETFGPLLKDYEIVADLPKEWLFLKDDESLGIGYYTAADLDESGWSSVRIGDWFQRQGYRFRGIAWYRCWFEVPEELEGKKVRLLFGGASTSHFYINGRWLNREQKNGVWIVDFTEVARFGQKNLVALGIITTGSPAGVYKSVKLAVRK